MKQIRILLSMLLFICLTASGFAQAKRGPRSAPKIDIEDYTIQATLKPESHELEALAAITFKVVETTDVVAFELSENLSVNKVLNKEGVEIEFGQDESGPGILTVRFNKTLQAGTTVTIKVDYTGGFDRDRYSRLYARDESSAFIGPDGTFLLYQSKWFPMNKFLVDRATTSLEVTVPLGITVVGPGRQLPVITKGVSETFRWSTKHPILPNSIVAARYFEKKVTSEGITIECFAREDHLQTIQQYAETLGKILAYYNRTFGPSAAGNEMRLVEVDDKLATQHGMLGTVFVTHNDLAQPVIPVRQLARRAAYQWWMETVGVQSTEELWLADGMAYYSAAQYLGESSGPAAFQAETNHLALLGLKFESKSAVRVGLRLGCRNAAYVSVVAGKGAWVIAMLRHLLGDEKFNVLLQNYVKNFAGTGGSTSGFLTLGEHAYGKELGSYFLEWIDAIGVPELQTDYVVFRTQQGFRV